MANNGSVAIQLTLPAIVLAGKQAARTQQEAQSPEGAESCVRLPAPAKRALEQARDTQGDTAERRVLRASSSQIAAANRAIAAHPERHRARVAVAHALRDGRLQRGPCAVGGDCAPRVESHHRDYSKPLDVVWLCTRHHKQLHAAERRAAA